MKARVLVLGGRRLSEGVRGIARGFQRIGCPVMYCATRRPGTKCDPLVDVFNVIGQHVQEFQPDVLFWCLCKQDCPPGLIKHLKRLRPEMKTVFGSFDDPYQIDYCGSPWAKDFDRAVTCCESSVKWYAEQGVKAACLYPPPDFELHHAPTPDANEACALSFVGTHMYPKTRYPEVLVNRSDILREAAKLGKLHLYGYWNERRFDMGREYGVPTLKACYRGFKNFDDLPGIYAATKVNINTHVRPDGYQYLNQRALNIMASGGFMLCDRVAGIEKLFKRGVHFDTFATPEEFRERACYWLQHNDERETIARAGCAYVWKRFSNEQHALRTLELCDVEIGS